jgi:hypothetical protein
MRTYVAQAKNQVAQVKSNAEAAFHRVAEDANPRIVQINDNVSEALSEASKASGERNAALNRYRGPVEAGGINLAVNEPDSLGPVAFQPVPGGTESVTVPGERLPRSSDMPTGAGDPDAISCRVPQQLPGSRLMGPEICKRNSEWAKLFKDGHSISPNGKQIVDAEKALTYNPQTCITRTEVQSGSPIIICSQSNR